jgi:hypothetical protein
MGDIILQQLAPAFLPDIIQLPPNILPHNILIIRFDCINDLQRYSSISVVLSPDCQLSCYIRFATLPQN